MRPAIFLDRDGVIVENRDDYVRSPGDISFIPGALPALAKLASSPFAIVIVTNQAAVGRGLISLAEAEAINRFVTAEIVRAGGRVDGAYLCPHRPDEGCECRKPRPGLLLQAAAELNLDLKRSWMIGDALTDLQAGEAAGARPLLVLTGRGKDQSALEDNRALPDLTTALEFIRRAAKGDGRTST